MGLFRSFVRLLFFSALSSLVLGSVVLAAPAASPSPGSLFETVGGPFSQVAFQAGQGTPLLYFVGNALDFGSTVAAVPAPCVISSGTASGISPLTAITSSNKKGLASCDVLFNSTGSSRPIDVVIKENIARVVDCYYKGRVIDVNRAESCESGTSTSLDGTNPRIVCSILDQEGSASGGGFASNHLGQTCGRPDVLPSPTGTTGAGDAIQWVDSQILGAWVMAVKTQLHEVLGELNSPAHILTIQSTGCQALAQDYLALLKFSKILSDGMTDTPGFAMPDVTQWDKTTCRPTNAIATRSSAGALGETSLPMSSLCYLNLAGRQLEILYAQLAQCEVIARADDLRSQFATQMSQVIEQISSEVQAANQVGQNYSQACSNKESVATEAAGSPARASAIAGCVSIGAISLGLAAAAIVPCTESAYNDPRLGPLRRDLMKYRASGQANSAFRSRAATELINSVNQALRTLGISTNYYFGLGFGSGP